MINTPKAMIKPAPDIIEWPVISASRNECIRCVNSWEDLNLQCDACRWATLPVMRSESPAMKYKTKKTRKRILFKRIVTDYNKI